MVMGAALLMKCGYASGQELAPPARGTPTAATFDWLSPSSLTMVRPQDFNWSQFPLLLNVNENAGYNDNILGLPTGQNGPAHQLRGDSFAQTGVGASTRFYSGAQSFFADASYGVTNYTHDIAYDTHRYSFDGGVDWKVGSRCHGLLEASVAQQQMPIEQQVVPGVNNVQTRSVTETGECRAVGDLGFVLNSGLLSTTYGSLINSLNNLDAKHVQGGVDYTLSGLDKLQFLTRFTDNRFPNRTALPGVLLVADMQQVDYQLFYNRTYSEKLSFLAMLGLSQPNVNSGQTGQKSDPLIPVYSVVLNWAPSTKWTISATASRIVSAPTSIVANSQLTNMQGATLVYHWTPKFNLQLGLSRSTYDAPQTAVSGIASYYANSAVTASFKALYQLTPFTSASASFQHVSRESLGLSAPANISMVGLNFRPY